MATPVAKLTKNSTGNSLLSIFESTLSGITRAVTPSTTAILAMLDPIALPIARVGLSPRLAVIEIKISGAEEPIATIVKPTIRGDTPKFLATADAPSVNRSALQIRSAIPIKTNAKFNNMDYSVIKLNKITLSN